MADGGYSAGNLVFQIQALGKDTTATFSRLNTHLKTSAFSITKLLNKVYFLRNYTKQMFSTISNMLKLAVDYTETLNLWQVAMRSNREEADEFVKTMHKAYGISTQTLMNYQAIFRNMLSSLGGLSENTSYALSEYLTQMAIDYASLYNTSIQKAMTTFQSVLSGQVRPIRSIAGYDITETTIYQLYQQLGGTKTMRQLTQTEKRLLRIYAVFQQMESSGAIGDLNATLNNTANQMRILTESTKELQTWFGLIVEDILKPALPYLNAFVITLTNITKAIATMRGVELFDRGAVESVEEINKELDKVQGKLLSFDRFEALNSSNDGDNLLGIDENLLAGLSQYDSILSQVTGKAQKLAEQWTDLIIDPETGGWTDFANTVQQAIKDLGILLGIVLAVKKPLLAVFGGLIALYSTDEDFRNSFNSLFEDTLGLFNDIGSVLKDIAPLLVDVFNFIVPALKWVVELLAKVNKWMIDANYSIFEWLGRMPEHLENVKNWFIGVGKAVGDFFVNAWKNIANSFASVINWISNAFISFVNQCIDALNFLLKPLDEIAGIFGGNVEIPHWEANVNWQPYPTETKNVGIASDSVASISSAIKQGANSPITVGDVYLDGRKVGQTTARYSHQENVRTGLVKATL